MVRAGWVILGLLAAACPALADEDFCIDPRTRAVDPRGTQALRQMLQAADRQAMQQISGTWYLEQNSPDTHQVSYLYQTFERNGLYSYQNRVCGAAGCSDYQGTGLYGLRATGDGGYAGVIMVSDLRRNHQCSGLFGRFDADGSFISGDGALWRRAR